MKISVLILVIVLSQETANAQNYYITLKGGSSDYEGVDFNISGASGDNHWAKEIIISAGAGLRVSNAFAVEALVEYSTHKYEPREWEASPTKDLRNTFTELTAIGKLTIVTISSVRLVGVTGLSLSFQREEYPTRELSKNGVSVPLGLGIECQITKNIMISIDGNWRLRFYVTPVAQIGLAYSL